MNRHTKILCVCRKGIYRSVETKRSLNKRGYRNVLSVGAMRVSQETLNMLCQWADIILLAKPEHGKRIKREYKYKIKIKFYIGDDLTETVRKQLDLLGFGRHAK